MAGAAAGTRTPGRSELVERCGWRCPEHGDRVAELFCRRCRRCVCALCPVLGAHRGHPVGLALEAAVHVQKLSQECLKQLAIKKQQHVDNITQIEDATEKLKANAESSKTWLKGKFTELRLLLDEEEALAKKFIDKNTQLTLQVYREQADSCREQLDVMNDLSNRVWSIGQEPDPVQRLQAYTATEQEMQQQMSLGELCHPVPLSFEPVKSFFKSLVEAVESILQTPLDIRLKESINCQLSDPSSTKPGTLLKTSPSPQRSLLLKYARTPTLDPDTMHARLRLSADRLTVRCGLLGSLGPVPALRFDALWQVLARDCFAAGRHYWEVDVQEAGAGWWVGAAYASLRRRGASAAARLGCNRQSWCLKRYDLEYWAFHDGQRSRLRPRDDLDRLGVFLDYEAGVLAFYDVTGGMSHLHTFRATFQEPLYPALRLWEGAISIPRLP
ncbi:tripartite motif-containing protein 14 isoform X1 [Pan troglodytes]|uniref:tripartite motif-containing protein 14 isoform X1 n=1 Tax=Pan troglodytes TaxID=9598 RepID=UPI0023F28379|nr:tripartite motif-containing protein 14 isoform X1 [Pan troglodytes]XP_520143.3 tripartite motif-containing protein 14 isoform X1 [Pan troglodytes]